MNKSGEILLGHNEMSYIKRRKGYVLARSSDGRLYEIEAERYGKSFMRLADTWDYLFNFIKHGEHVIIDEKWVYENLTQKEIKEVLDAWKGDE